MLPPGIHPEKDKVLLLPPPNGGCVPLPVVISHSNPVITVGLLVMGLNGFADIEGHCHVVLLSGAGNSVWGPLYISSRIHLLADPWPIHPSIFVCTMYAQALEG